MYEPREDSYLLEKEVKRFAIGNVLDIGTGSGIQALAAAGCRKVRSVLAVDIDRGVIEACKAGIRNAKITFLQSDLFSNVKGKFDTIIFNPPYLPLDQVPNIALDGGKHGYELTKRFLDSADEHLKTEGKILLLISSLTKKDKVEQFLKEDLFDFRIISEQYVGGFENLYVYMILKSDFLKELERLMITGIKKLASGHRGEIYTGIWKGKKVAIKRQLPALKFDTITNEIKVLKKINKYKIGPKLLLVKNKCFIYEFISGDFIEKFAEGHDKKQIKKVLLDVFNQCFILDKLKLNKEEMHHPYKHIVVGKKAVLLDFERCKPTSDPKNVSQFCQYIISSRLSEIMRNKGFRIDKNKIIELSKQYKKDFSNKNFNAITDLLS